MLNVIQDKDLPFIGTRIRILKDASEGLAYLHCSGPGNAPLIHLDIKRYAQEAYYVLESF